MGEIIVTHHPAVELTLCTVIGSMTPDQIQSQIHRNLTNHPTRYVMWDVRGGSLTEISRADWLNMLRASEPHVHGRAGGKSAIVAAADVDFGLSRMFELLAEGHELPFDIRVFRTVQEAEGWLGLSVPPLA
jgi:hypothetical protein